MVSNIVVRNKRTGYVTFVAKARVDGESRTVEYICGLGNMTQEEFKTFQKWAHSMKDQNMRRARVLACPMVVEEKKIIREKVAAHVQKKTTVKRPPKKVVVVNDAKKAAEKALEREKFRRAYEAKKGVTQPKKRAGVKRMEGMRFTSRQSIVQKKKKIDVRIAQLYIHIDNIKTDIRGWQKGRAGGQKVADARIKLMRYEDAVRVLRKQKAEMRR